MTLFLADDLTGPLAPRAPSRLGLTYENYKLALTDSLLDDVFTTAAGQDAFDVEARAVLAETATRPGFLVSGYATGRTVLGPAGAGQWWVRSGVAGFAPDAPAHFYLPERYLDPFGNESSLRYDDDDLFVRSSTDPVGNTTDVLAFDHRVLAPARMRDANRNVSEVAFDILGLPVAMALRGKVSAGAQSSETGDGVAQLSLAQLNPQPGAVAAFFTADPFDADQARRWLGTATTRFVYHLGDSTDAAGVTVWGDTAAGACAIQRERHERDAPNSPAADVAIQVSFDYSDGAGQSFVTKNQAEPDPRGPGNGIRWIANGKTIVNNKGSPVLQYEPYFTESGHRFAEPRAVGVSAILYYDAAGRAIRTEFPDGSLARVDVTPWRSVAYDRNDTVTDPGNRWYADHTVGTAAEEDRRAARLAALHRDTPTETHVDSLGRAVVTVARNQAPAAGPVGAPSVADVAWAQERLLTFTKLDAEGKPLFVRDARGNRVMRFLVAPGPAATGVPGYDIAGNLLFQHSMDAGDRRMLADGAGQALLGWDYNERRDATTPRVFKEHRRFRVRYDALRRPLERRLRIRDETSGAVRESLVERFRYGEDAPSARAHNLRGRVWQHYDSSGLAQTDDVDLGGRSLVSRRRLASDITAPIVEWDGVQVSDIHRAALAGFERDVYTQRCEYDALGRITRLYNWHVESPRNSGRSDRVAVYLPTYNQRGMLAAETLFVRARKAPAGHDVVPFVTRRQDAVTRIDYDAKGQKLRLDLGNGTVTRYDYDSDTFRLRELRTSRPGHDPGFPSERGRLSDARVLQHLFYTHDPAGNITEIRDDAWRPAFFSNQRVEAAGQYVYDALYRLIEASGREDGRVNGAPAQFGTPVALGGFPDSHPDAVRNYIERYRYDAVGNLESMRHIAGPLGTWTRTFDYASANNRLLATDTDNPGRHVGYGYDTHGSMANLNAAPERFDLRWDWNDMIHTIDLGGGGRAWYQYASDKQRCRKRIDTQHGSAGYWERVYLPGFELYRRYRAAGDAAPVEEIETHHLFERDQRVLQVDDVLSVSNPRPDGVLVKPQTLFRYQYGNLIGSACLELDHTAAVISYEEYHPYGSTAHHATLSTTEAPPKRYRYAGLEKDEETGLAYHWARHYVPWLARWCGSDPEPPSGLANRYTYCSGSPTTRVDPSGRADNRRVGEIGELLLQQKLDDKYPGRFFVFLDTQKDVSATGFDLPAYDRSTGKFVVFDNKAAGEIRDVGAFERYTRYLPEAKQVIARYGDTEEAALALRAIARNDYQLIASNFFAPTEGRVSELLFSQGYHLLDIRTGVISETHQEMLKAAESVSASALRSSEGRLVGALRRGGSGAVVLGLAVGLTAATGHAATVEGGPAVNLGDVQFDIAATRNLSETAKTQTQKEFASAISGYASLLIKWEFEGEKTAVRSWARGGDEPVKDALNPFNFILGGWLSSSSVSAREGRTPVGEAVQRTEAAIARIEQGLAKNELTLRDSERAGMRSRLLSIWGWTPQEAAAQVAGF